MKNVKKFNSRFSALIVLVLVAAMVLSFAACGGNPTSSDANVNSPAGGVTEIGEGAKSFLFEVVDQDGGTASFQVSTDADTVGAALLDAGLVAGEDSAYGLYVKTVNGVTLDYDTDGMYWAFYVDGEYASTGVDQTEIIDGATYSFRAEK